MKYFLPYIQIIDSYIYAPYFSSEIYFRLEYTIDLRIQEQKMQKCIKKTNEFILFFTDFYATIWARKVTQEEKIK